MYLDMITDKVKDEKVIIDMPRKSSAGYHMHDFLEMTYVLEGKANHVIEGVPSLLSAGDYFIVDYNKYHKYNQIGEEPFKVINCMFIPELIDETLKHCTQMEEVVNNYLIKFDFYQLEGHPSNYIFHDDGYVGQLFHRLEKEYSNKNMGYLETMRCYVIELLITMMRQIQLPDPTESENKMVRHIIKYAQKNFTQDLSLKLIAKEYNYSLSHVSYIFKSEVGIPFQEYVQSIRIRESCRLLVNTSKKISDIACLVGYTDTKFFTELFKRQMKMTPGQFRKTYTSN